MEKLDISLFKEYIWVVKPQEHREKMQRNAVKTLVISQEHLLFPTLGTLLNDLLTLSVNLLVVDIPRSLALLALGLLRLHAHGSGTTGANLLLSIFPRRGAVINFVSED